jgi:N-acetylmuramoyl-L-alanine amidase
VATRDGETARLTLPIRLRGARAAADAGARATVAPAREGVVRVTVPAPGALGVTVRSADDTLPGSAGVSLARSDADATLWTGEVPSALTRGGAVAVIATADAEVARVPLTPAPAPARAPFVPRRAVLGSAAVAAARDSEPTVIARPVPGGTYKWFLFPGTSVRVVAAQGASRRVQLDDQLAVWVDSSLVRDADGEAPRRVASNPRVVPAEGWVDVVLPVGARPPFLVEEQGRTLVLTLYGTQADTDIIHYLANDTLVRNINWTQETSDRARYTIELSRAPYGYLVLWRGTSLVLRVRRPPPVDARRPLAGLTVAVDPGHPPIGSTGPTGLYEGVATLAVGRRVQALLEERGARVVMTRTTDAPVALGDRPALARREDAHALVSIHLNALPDGINPLVVNGTGTYFFHPHAEPLARAVQRGMVRRMGLRDLGVYYDNLALARPTWMPSVLCEGAFIIVPEQEAAMRTPEYQQRYALGVVEGLEAYFRALPDR